ncbi:MAG: polysaccharide deacetylase family protein [Rhodocyclales bacterium]|nr:polysaccharide deacetylase family protein [Rhodocyclales bacterium]
MSDPAHRRWQPTPLIVISVLLHALALLALLPRPELWPWSLAVIAINQLLITAAGLWPRSHWLGPNWTRLPAAAITRNEVAITIDDGPDPLVTPAVLDILDAHGAHATFFCIGTQARAHPDLIADIVRRGHSVENHSQHHHHNFSLLGPRGFRREILAAQHTLSELSGQPPRFFRAPAGLRNPFLEPVLAHAGLRLASWTRRGYDTHERDPARVAARLLDRLAAGDILLLHDGHAARTTDGQPVILAVLPRVLATCRAAGLRPVTLEDACQ